MADNSKQVTGWVGWVYFAGLLMVMIGIFQSISGLTALLKSNYYVVTPQHLIAFDITTWGWVHLVMGILVIAAGSAVVNGRLWGRIIGVFLAMLSAIANFVFLSAYPIWSIIAITIDILIIYALMVHGNEAAPEA